MARRHGATLVAALVIGLALPVLTSCGPNAASRTSSTPRGHRPRSASSPFNSAAALNQLERQLQDQGRSMGYAPAGPIGVGHRAGKVRWLVWTATNGGVCHGSGTLGIGPAHTACWPATALPSALGSALAPLGQSSASAGRYVTLLAAAGEQLRGVSCAGTHLTIDDVLSPTSTTTLYEVVSDWPFRGTATATVQRPSGPATEPLRLPTTTAAAGRTCG